MNVKFRIWLIGMEKYLHQLEINDFCFGILRSDGLETIDSMDGLLINALSVTAYKFEYFTGKHDRDGKEIYENDIIRMKFCESWEEEHEEDFKVYWAEGHAGFALESLKTQQCIFSLENISNCQLVGNIHNA